MLRPALAARQVTGAAELGIAPGRRPSNAAAWHIAGSATPAAVIAARFTRCALGSSFEPLPLPGSVDPRSTCLRLSATRANSAG